MTGAIQLVGALCALVGFFVLLAAQLSFDEMTKKLEKDSPRVGPGDLMHPGRYLGIHHLHRKKYPQDEALRERELMLTLGGVALIVVGFVIIAIASSGGSPR
jgi:hypothetical protein